MESDNTLMLKLLLFAVEDYVEEWATAPFRNTVKEACKRFGIEYSHSGRVLMERVERRLHEKAAVLHDPAATVGNVAATREALTDISRALEKKMEDCPASVTAHEMAIYRRCKAALAEPARNVENYKSQDDAWFAYKTKRGGAAYFDLPSYVGFVDWLFAISGKGGES